MNALFIVKVLVSALVIAAATEVAKRHPFWGAVIIALPLTSILAMSWLYAETRDNALLTQFARDIFVIVPVSLVFFLPFWLEKRRSSVSSPTCCSGSACWPPPCSPCGGFCLRDLYDYSPQRRRGRREYRCFNNKLLSASSASLRQEFIFCWRF